MKLIVGLGNPGKEYENTRHNVGFMVLDSFLTDFTLEKKFQALLKTCNIEGEKCLFVKPLTYMNESGLSVGKIAKYYNILPEDILVIQDDMDLPFGRHKIKINSSAGGHNGIKSIIHALGTDSFARLKIGIAHDKGGDAIHHVLGKFSKDEMNYFKDNYSLYKEIIYSFVQNGIPKTMNKYNTK